MSQVVDESPPVEVVQEDENKASILGFPNEILVNIYSNLDYESRLEMRKLENKRLLEIEKETKYRYFMAGILALDDSFHMLFGENELAIPRTDAKEELEIMEKTTRFNVVAYTARRPHERKKAIKELRFLKAKRISVDDALFENADLPFVVQDREVLIVTRSSITTEGLMWLYEKMRDRQLNLKKVRIDSGLWERRMEFMEELGTFDLYSCKFSTTNPNMKVANRKDGVIITEGHLKIVIKGIDDMFDDTDDEMDSDDEEVDRAESGCILFKVIDVNKKNNK